MRFEAGEASPVEATTKLEHAERAGDQGHIFLGGDVDGLCLRLFAAYKDYCPDLGDLRGPDHLGIGQAGQQDRFRLAGGEHIAHQVGTAAAADFDVHIHIRI